MKKFECKICNYSTNRKYNLNIHYKSKKHKNQNQRFFCNCGKSYKYKSGLCKHKKICEMDNKLQEMKNEIIELASNILAQSAPKAAMKLVDVMESDNPIPQANIRIQAAQTILDRTGLGKQERMDVNHKVEGGLFILPAKDEIIIDAKAEIE